MVLMERKNIFITGVPGVGKTTLLRKVVAGIPRNVSCKGFFTGEVRESGVRVGFEMTTLKGHRGLLAHTNLKTGYRVGRYGVDVTGFEDVCLSLFDSTGVHLFIIDEVGKMECLSELFCQNMRKLLEAGPPVLGSIALKGGGFIREVKSRTDVDIVTLTHQNQDGLAPVLRRKVMNQLG